MLKQISLIALVAIGIGTVFLANHAPAFAACSGNPHDRDSTASGNPHDSGEAGNPHDVRIPGSGTGGELDLCPGSK